jgi:YhcH/YjgK/YiaL family protein
MARSRAVFTVGFRGLPAPTGDHGLAVMALYGSFATVRAQAQSTPGFLTAFAYVGEVLRPGSPAARRLAGIAAGQSEKIDLGGGVFVIEQAYETKPRAEGFFESHRKYIDVQVVVAGEELMELADIDRMTVRDSYNPDRDLVTYNDHAGATLLRTKAGDAAIFYPADVHMPSLRLGSAPVLVRKAVVKVPVA